MLLGKVTLHNLKQKNKGKAVVYYYNKWTSQITKMMSDTFFIMDFKILGSVDLWMDLGTFLPPPQGICLKKMLIPREGRGGGGGGRGL